jgi:uncharacterized membrane protein YgcG
MTRTTLRRAFAALLFALLLLCSRAASAGFTPPPMRDAVTDTAGRLTDADDRALEERITAYRNKTGNEIAVLVIGSLAGNSVEDVAYGTFNTWHIGKKDLDNGVLLVIAPNERKTRIETGKGIGDKLTDVECAMILRERVGPLLREDRFREAIEAALEAIEAALDGAPTPGLPASLTSRPLVRGAYVDDVAGALPDATLAEIEAAAAREGRYWQEFAVVIVEDPLKNENAGLRLYEKRQTVPALKGYTLQTVYVGARDRRVSLSTRIVKHAQRQAVLVPRLVAVAKQAPTLEAAVRAVAAEMVADAKRIEAHERAVEKAAAEQKAHDDRVYPWIIGALVLAGLLLFVGLPLYLARRGGGSCSSGSSGSSSSYDGGSSSSSYSGSSSSNDSSSSDTSYTGGGGSSGGGGASDSY